MIAIIMIVFLECLSMWNMLNCAEHGQIQKYKAHPYKDTQDWSCNSKAVYRCYGDNDDSLNHMNATVNNHDNDEKDGYDSIKMVWRLLIIITTITNIEAENSFGPIFVWMNDSSMSGHWIFDSSPPSPPPPPLLSLSVSVSLPPTFRSSPATAPPPHPLPPVIHPLSLSSLSAVEPER